MNDTTCVLVFPTNSDARAAFSLFHASGTEEPSTVDYVIAKPLPQELWPVSDSTPEAFGREEGLRGDIFMRLATIDDVKKKGAKQQLDYP